MPAPTRSPSSLTTALSSETTFLSPPPPRTFWQDSCVHQMPPLLPAITVPLTGDSLFSCSAPKYYPAADNAVSRTSLQNADMLSVRLPRFAFRAL